MNEQNQLNTTSRSRAYPTTNGPGKTMKFRGFVTIGSIILKVLHVLVAGWCALACPLALLDHCNSWLAVVLNSLLTSACFIWFVVAVGLWSGPWFQRMSTVGTTVVKIVNVILAGLVLTFCIYCIFWGIDPVTTSTENGVTTTSAVKQGLQQEAVGELACYSTVLFLWLLCAIGLLFKKHWARWGNLLIVIAYWGFALWQVAKVFCAWQADDSGMVGLGLGLALAFTPWWVIVLACLPFLLSALLVSFLLATRHESVNRLPASTSPT